MKFSDDSLPDDLLQALGTEGEENAEVGEAIRPELALRWTRIIQTGLGKESREAITKKYPMPINFPRAVAPSMNAEISASLSDPTLKRDKRISYRQNLTGKLMTCLGKSLSKVLMGNINSKVLVEEINDAAKLAAEIYYQDSSSRRFFALAGVNKVVQDAVRTAIPDDTLFGTDCAEKIRAAQAIQRAGSMIKTTEKKAFKSGTQKKQVNWRGPPQYQQQQRARGGHQPQQHQHPRQLRLDQARWKIQKPAPSSSKSRYRR